MEGGRRLLVVAALAAAPAACTALFPLSGISDGDTGGDGSTPDGEAADAPVDGSPGAPDADGRPPGEAAASEGGGADAPKDVAAEATATDASAEGPPETGGKDAPADVPKETGVLTYAQQVLLDLPAAYWRLGEASGTTAKDSSGNALNGVYQGNVGLGAPGAIANDPDAAATFDGATSYVDMGQILQFAGNAAYSVEVWAAPTVDANYHGLLSRNDENGPPSAGYLLYIEPSPTPFYDLERLAPPSSKTITESSYQATSGTWAHVVATYDGATILLYVNGALQDSQSSPFASSAASDFVVGAQAGGATSWWLGRLDEVAVYDHVLPPARILAHYHVGLGQPP